MSTSKSKSKNKRLVPVVIRNMQCKTCNADNGADSRFCKRCGQPLEDTRPASSGLTQEEHIRIGELIYSAFKYKEAGDVEKAILACQGALALNDASAQAHVLLATLYQSKGDIAAAMYEYERALELDPQNASTKHKLDDLRAAPVLPAEQSTEGWMGRMAPYAPFLAFGAVFVFVLLGLTIFFTGGSNQQAETPPAQRPTYPQTTAPIQPYARNPYPQAQTQTPVVQQPQPYVAPPVQAPAQSQQTASDARQSSASQPRQRAPIFPVSRPRPVQSPSYSQLPAPRLQPIPRPVITPTRPVVVSQPSPPPKPAPAPSVDPEQRAVQLQRAGNYNEAISSYKEALNRTSDSGRVYQQIAICNQRIGNNSAAVNSYNQAIRSYRDQLAAGRDAAEVQRNIRACEAGIAVSKGH